MHLKNKRHRLNNLTTEEGGGKRGRKCGKQKTSANAAAMNAKRRLKARGIMQNQNQFVSERRRRKKHQSTRHFEVRFGLVGGEMVNRR